MPEEFPDSPVIEEEIIVQDGTEIDLPDGEMLYTLTYDNTSTDSILQAMYESQLTYQDSALLKMTESNTMLLNSLDNYKMSNTLLLCLLFVVLFINFKEYLRGWFNVN